MNAVQPLSARALNRELAGLIPPSAVGVRERCAQLGTRSVKGATKKQWLDLAVAMVDLTSLEGSDTPRRVESLSRKALQPDHTDPTCPHVAAVCVYPDLVPVVRETVGTALHVAAVATAFPSGRASLPIKLADTRLAIEGGADEIDMVIDRGAFLAGDYETVYTEIAAIKEACEGAHLKVILETGELGSLHQVLKASWLAMLAGADTIKTSTGKAAVNATPASVLVMLEAVKDYGTQHGATVGVKVAGGVRNSKEALSYLVLVKETLGQDWMTPDRFRFGASTLLNDLIMQRRKQSTGRYPAPYHVSTD